jgi:hypothetical protein
LNLRGTLTAAARLAAGICCGFLMGSNLAGSPVSASFPSTATHDIVAAAVGPDLDHASSLDIVLRDN